MHAQAKMLLQKVSCPTLQGTKSHDGERVGLYARQATSLQFHPTRQRSSTMGREGLKEQPMVTWSGGR